MRTRRRRNIVSTRKIQKLKRKRQMDHVQIASPHEGDFYIENEVNFEPPIKRMFYWFYNKLPSVSSTISFASQKIFSVYAMQKDLDLTQNELSIVKQELKQVSAKLKSLEADMKKLSSQPRALSIPQPPPVPSMSCIPPPPPPPPPPLPTLNMKKPKLVIKKKVATDEKNLKKDNPKQASLCVTLDDILKVKLKKTKDALPRNQDKENKAPSHNMPRISLSDITSISLKSLPITNTTDVNGNITPKSVLLRKTLRKTTMKRSPGGTPVIGRSKILSTATGPTPEFERALRRKFRSIRTSPLVEDNTMISPR